MSAEECAMRQFSLVYNDSGDISWWPASKAVPPGWYRAGFVGSREECLTELERRAATCEQHAVPTDGETLVSMFDRIARRFPDRPAVTDDRLTLTYTELNAQAIEFGHRLSERGVGPGDRVVIHLSRGTSVFVSMLGILRSGAAYVAVDVRYPDARRDLMIRKSRPALIVTDPERAQRVSGLDRPILTGDEPAVAMSHRSVPIRPDDSASVLFTSGSTGTPKAIVLAHRNLVYFGNNSGLAELRPGDRVGQVSSVSFDAFHFETWCAFAHGAEVVVLPSMAELISLDMQRELRRRRISVLLAPTMAVNHVVYEDQDAFAPLRLLFTGGDVLQPGACRQLLAGSFRGKLYNLYGPAECTTACTAHLVNGLAADATSVPIGTPLPGADVHVLDSCLDKVPDGAVGELHLSGSGVARGYLDEIGRTAERFLPDPFNTPGCRMYATGDLARWSSDGHLEFAGRLDDQVKIHGFRVEPREVETAIAGHPSVREAAVVATGSGTDKRLVALVVLDARVPPSRLRQYTTELLPDYMVPSAFVNVPEIPGNEHGKRDLDKLAELAEDQLKRQADREPPAGEIEQYLATVWEEMLSVESISRTDDFFILGGNSLLAFRLQRRIARDLNVTVNIQDVLSTGRLADLSELIRQDERTA